MVRALYRRWPRLTLAAGLGLFCTSANGGENEMWNRHALTLSYGYMDSGITINGRDAYPATRLGNKGITELSWTLTTTSKTDLDLAVSHLRASGSQRRDGNIRAMTATQWGLHADMRRFPLLRTYPFDPWWGGGITAGWLESDEAERRMTAGGALWRPARSDSHALFGARIMAGLDIYPFRDTALIVRIQTRYDWNIATGGFEGHSGGFSLHTGLYWRFWPVSI